MKLNVNAPSRHWEEAAIIAREQEIQGLVPEGKDNAIPVTKKFHYLVWKTKTAVNVELVANDD